MQKEIIMRDIDKVIPYENNPRVNDEAVEIVAQSIKEFGFKNPIIVDKHGIVIAGHTRLKASYRLGLPQVPIIVAQDLNDEQVKAFRLVDNRTSEVATWDFKKLEEELEKIDIDLGNFDFDFSSMNGFEDFLKNDELETEAQEDEDFDLEQELLDIVEPNCCAGEIYELGKHRLMCSDSTNLAEVQKLMNGKQADLVVTDPPYNVNYHGTAGSIKNDNLEDNEFKQFLINAFTNMENVLKVGGSFYIWYASREAVNFLTALKESNLESRQELIWVKNALVMGRQDYQWKHEPCLYGWKDGATHNWYSDRAQTTILEYNKPTKNDLHPTQKPIPLFDYLIKNSSKKKEIVLDLFGGSGTTLIACEQNERTAYLMEYDPKFCDVIIKRWEMLTGQKAKLITS